MMIKNNGVDIDSQGIMSVFFTDEKIISMSIDIVDNKVSKELLKQAPKDYADELVKLIDSINDNVMVNVRMMNSDRDDDAYWREYDDIICKIQKYFVVY